MSSIWGTCHPESRIIENILKKNNLKSEEDRKEWLENITGLGIEYVIVNKEENWRDFVGFLGGQDAFVKVFDSKNLVVFKLLIFK